MNLKRNNAVAVLNSEVAVLDRSSSNGIYGVFQDWIDYKSKYVKPSTLSVYVIHGVRHILPFFGDRVGFSEGNVQEFIYQKLRGGLSAKSVTDLIITIKMIHKHGVKYFGWERVDYDLHIPTEYKKKNNVEVFTKKEQKEIIQYVLDNFTFRNLGILICLNTGMRIGEICALKWKDIDFDEGVINVSRALSRIYMVGMYGADNKTQIIEGTPKTQSAIRDIPFTKKLHSMLKPLAKIVNPEYYVLTNDRNPTEPRSYREYYHALMKELGMPSLKFHCLRHTFATRCIEGGADYKTVSSLLGHAQIATTLNIYCHPNIDQKRKVVNSIMSKI